MTEHNATQSSSRFYTDTQMANLDTRVLNAETRIVHTVYFAVFATGTLTLAGSAIVVTSLNGFSTAATILWLAAAVGAVLMTRIGRDLTRMERGRRTDSHDEPITPQESSGGS